MWNLAQDQTYTKLTKSEGPIMCRLIPIQYGIHLTSHNLRCLSWMAWIGYKVNKYVNIWCGKLRRVNQETYVDGILRIDENCLYIPLLGYGSLKCSLRRISGVSRCNRAHVTHFSSSSRFRNLKCMNWETKTWTCSSSHKKDGSTFLLLY